VVYLIYLVVVVVGRYIHQKNRAEIPYLTQEDSDGGEEEVSPPVHPTVTGNPPEIQLVPESQDCTSITMNLKLLLAALNPLDLEAWS